MTFSNSHLRMGIKLRAAIAAGSVIVAALFSVAAAASSTYVGSVTYSASPLHPAPNAPFKVTATFHGAGHGQPCDISNIRATIQGVTVNGRPSSGYTHPPSDPSLTSTFEFPNGFAAGSLAPAERRGRRRDARARAEAPSGARAAPRGDSRGERGGPAVTPAEFARAADQDGPGSDVRRHLDCVSRGLSVTRTRRVCAVKLSRGSGASFAPEAPADLGAGRVAGAD